MTTDQFLEQATLDLQVFIESYKRHAQAEPDVYESNHDLERWWQEFGAYQTMLRLEQFLEDRRCGKAR